MITTTLAAFQAATATNSKTKARGSNLVKIDMALDRYWREGPAANNAKQISLASALASECVAWLRKKELKSDFKSGLFGKTNFYNQLLLKRRNEVSRLAAEVYTELRQLMAGGAFTPNDFRRIDFDQRKATMLGKKQTQRPDAQGLSSGYEVERKSYLASGKVSNVAGSGLHEIDNQIKIYRRNNMDVFTELGLQFSSGEQKSFYKALAKDPSKLSVPESQLLDRVGRAAHMTGDMNYLRKADRLAYMLIPDGNGLLIDPANNPVTSPTNEVWAYAMDRYGNLFSKNADPLNGAYYFNHSSFNAGKEVICAGILSVTNGRLMSLNNSSGHYKPGRDNLHNCITILHEEGVDLTQTVVSLWEAGATGMQESRYRAATFVANKNAAADLP